MVNAYTTTTSTTTTTTTTTTTDTTTETTTSTTSTALTTTTSTTDTTTSTTSETTHTTTEITTFSASSSTSTPSVSQNSLINLLFDNINNNNVSVSSNATQEINLFSIDVNIINDIISSNYDINDCLQNCSNNGNCKLSSSDNKLVCSCFEGYSGSSCEIGTNPCISNNPCLNNSTCTSNATNLYECKCDASKYYGANCENKIDLCLNITCSSQGVCEIDDLTKQPSCKCVKYYSGVNCETPSAELKSIESFVSFALVISIMFIIAIYLVFILNDLLNYFFGKNIKLRIAREKEK